MYQLVVDGACPGNPGYGGYGIIVTHPDGTVKKLSGQITEKTTNNRAEYLAVIEGLKLVPVGHKAEVYSDSLNIIDSYEKDWVKQWKENGWRKNKTKKPPANLDLVIALDELVAQREVNFYHVPRYWNLHTQWVKADKMAKRAAFKASLIAEVDDNVER